MIHLRLLILLLCVAVGYGASTSPVPALTAINGDLTATQKVNAANVDTNFANTRNTVNSLLAALKVSLRDDNTLQDSIVRLRNLALEVSTIVASQGWQPKQTVVCATTANITLSGEQTIDGVLTSASRVLVKDQTTASQNGIYLSAAGAWSRATDTDTAAEIGYAAVSITGGTINASRAYVVTLASSAITLGTTSVTWAQFGSNVAVLPISGGGTGGSAPSLWPTSYRLACVAVGVANLAVSAPGATIDGVTLATGDRVLLTAQSTASQNGIWSWNGAAAALTRPLDYPVAGTVQAFLDLYVPIRSGTSYSGSVWRCTTTGVVTIDSTSTAWTATTTDIQRQVDTIAALKALTGGSYNTVLLRGYYAVGDCDTRTYRWNAADATADNGGTVIAPTAGTGRWNLIYSGVLKVKWFGAKGDGSTDDTTVIQNAMNAAVSGSQAVLFFDPLTYSITNYIRTPSGLTVYGYGATIKAASSMAMSISPVIITDVTFVVGANNVRIYGLTVDGNRSGRSTGTHGGANYYISAGSYIKLVDCISSNSVQEGFQAAGDTAWAGGLSTCVDFINCRSDNAYRNGLSLTGTDRATIQGGQYNSTNGANPQAGIDIEPNSATSPNKAFIVSGVSCISNTKSGIVVTSSTYGNTGVISNISAQLNGEYGVTSDAAPDAVKIDNVSGALNGIALVGGGYAFDRSVIASRTIQTVNLRKNGSQSFTSTYADVTSGAITYTPRYANCLLRIRCKYAFALLSIAAQTTAAGQVRIVRPGPVALDTNWHRIDGAAATLRNEGSGSLAFDYAYGSLSPITITLQGQLDSGGGSLSLLNIDMTIEEVVIP